jgi:Holliday junction resolvase
MKRRLEAEGWIVWRTPGSKSPADLICLKASRTLLVQCKNGPGKHDTDSLLELALLVKAEAALAMKDGRDIRWFEVN